MFGGVHWLVNAYDGMLHGIGRSKKRADLHYENEVGSWVFIRRLYVSSFAVREPRR